MAGLGIREILTEPLQKSWRRHKVSKCFYSKRTNCLISFIPFLLFHNFTIWLPWNALVTGCFCFQTSSLLSTKKGETQNFHQLTVVWFQRHRRWIWKYKVALLRKRGTRCVARAYRKEGAIDNYARLELRRYLQIDGQNTFVDHHRQLCSTFFNTMTSDKTLFNLLHARNNSRCNLRNIRAYKIPQLFFYL